MPLPARPVATNVTVFAVVSHVLVTVYVVLREPAGMVSPTFIPQKLPVLRAVLTAVARPASAAARD